MDYNRLKEAIDCLNPDIEPRWGRMDVVQMLHHCNNFIEVSLGLKKASKSTILIGRLFGFLFLAYLKNIKFNIDRFPKNSYSFKEFKNQHNLKDFVSERYVLTKNFQKVDELNKRFTHHQIYGKIRTELFKKLVYFHTSYHLKQFRVYR